MGDAVRSMWLVMTVLCCIWSFVACLTDDPSGAFALGSAGLVFWIMSYRSYDDLDSL